MLLSASININAQTILKVGGSIANRWNETLNNQTLGNGFRASAEKFITTNLSTGINISHFSFNPTPSVDITYSAASFHYTYYLNKKALQPYTGIGIGYNLYIDRTTLDLGNNAIVQQKRSKNYGVVSPFIGLKYTKKEKKLGIFFQVNTDFVPIANTTPIGFLSSTLGLSTQL
jgi:opacity protein-like surface antigen